MPADNLLPIQFAGWDEVPGDYGDIQLYNVTFLEDFGPFSSGDFVSYLGIHQSKGIVAEYDARGNQIKSVKVKLVPA